VHKIDAVEGVELFHAVCEEGSDKLDIKDLTAGKLGADEEEPSSGSPSPEETVKA
jgi:hypothetical protein